MVAHGDKAPAALKGHPVLGHLPLIREDFVGFLTAVAACGDYVPIQLGPFTPAYLVSDPKAIHALLTSERENFKKDVTIRVQKRLIGNGLISSHGELWLRQRRLMQPAFHKERIHAYAATMVAFATELTQSWEDGTQLDLYGAFNTLTLRVVGKALFGVDVQTAQHAHVSAVLTTTMETFMARLGYPDWLPIPANWRFRRAVGAMEDLIYGFIREHQQNQEVQDLLAMLLTAARTDKLDEQQLRDELITLFLAGHDTTSAALAWISWLIASHPEVETKVFAELDALGHAPGVADVAGLRYLSCVVAEGLRLYPPGFFLGREALVDCRIGALQLRRGEAVYFSPFVIQRDSRIYSDADQFWPERWTEDFEKTLPPGSYIPFGAGPRKCIGQDFARLQLMLTLATVYQHVRFVLRSEHQVVPQVAQSLRPNAVVVTLQRRSNAL